MNLLALAAWKANCREYFSFDKSDECYSNRICVPLPHGIINLLQSNRFIVLRLLNASTQWHSIRFLLFDHRTKLKLFKLHYAIVATTIKPNENEHLIACIECTHSFSSTLESFVIIWNYSCPSFILISTSCSFRHIHTHSHSVCLHSNSSPPFKLVDVPSFVTYDDVNYMINDCKRFHIWINIQFLLIHFALVFASTNSNWRWCTTRQYHSKWY